MFVTTVIPTFNRAADVVVAVDSALAQRYPRDRHEVIVVDDGSTDDTPTVLARYGDAIRTLRVANGGVAAARNHGIAEARGEAIAFLDSDDTWDPDKLALQADVLASRPDIAMVLTSMKIVDERGRMKGTYSRRLTLPVDGRVLPYVLRNPSMTPSSAMVRTHVARELTGFDPGLRTAEDLDFHLRLALRHGVAVIDRPLLHYTRAEGSLGDSVRSYHDYMLVMRRFLKVHGAEVDRRTRRVAMYGAYVRNGCGLATHGEIRGALRFGLGGLRNIAHARDVLGVANVAVQLARTMAARAWKRLSRGGRFQLKAPSRT